MDTFKDQMIFPDFKRDGMEKGTGMVCKGHISEAMQRASSRKQRQPVASMCRNSLPLLHPPRTGRQTARRNKISRTAL